MRCALFRIVAAFALSTTVLMLLGLAGCGQNGGTSTRATSPPRNAHWNDKALSSPRAAERHVGGFNAADRAAYLQGLQHITNQHQVVGSFTIAQVVDQEKARELRVAQAAQAIREAKARQEAAAGERRRRVAEAAAYAAAHHDYCKEALDDEKITSADSTSYRRAYDAAVSGLTANEKCADDTDRLINEGYLLSMKGMAEHHLAIGDWRTDFNQANQLLVECQTKPGLYGTHVAASCETQEHYNISAETNWDIESRE